MPPNNITLDTPEQDCSIFGGYKNKYLTSALPMLAATISGVAIGVGICSMLLHSNSLRCKKRILMAENISLMCAESMLKCESDMHNEDIKKLRIYVDSLKKMYNVK